MISLDLKKKVNIGVFQLTLIRIDDEERYFYHLWVALTLRTSIPPKLYLRRSNNFYLSYLTQKNISM